MHSALQGRSDYPLTEEGILQAKEAAKKLEGIIFSYVFTSPLVRAKDTASIVAPDVKAVTEGRLIEMDYGPYEGMTLQNPAPEVLHFFKDFVHNEAPEGMEPLSSVVKRAGEFIEEIKDLQGNILISTHTILMKGILEYLTPDSNGREEGTLTSSSEVAQYPQGTGAATGSPLRSGWIRHKEGPACGRIPYDLLAHQRDSYARKGPLDLCSPRSLRSGAVLG